MNSEELESRIVRYGDLIPCKTAFIDAHTPGSDQKENFTIIGGGVSKIHQGLILAQPANRQDVETLYTVIPLPKSFLF
jgi:hypothetical protein